MTITQTVDIPDSRRLIIDVPREIPTGRAIIAFTPADEKAVPETFMSTDEALASAREIIEKHRPAFEALAK